VQLETAPVSNGSVSSPAATLVIVALASSADRPPSELVDSLRATGAIVYVTHGSSGCLRAMASVQPRAVYLDPRLPKRMVHMLRTLPVGERLALFTLAGARL
jgi:hypothetical protein